MRSLVIALLLLAAACDPKEYVCSADRECVSGTGVPGRCVATHCAFSDQACVSRLRFDDSAGSDANKCVDTSLIAPDAGGVPDASIVDAHPIDAPLADAPAGG